MKLQRYTARNNSAVELFCLSKDVAELEARLETAEAENAELKAKLRELKQQEPEYFIWDMLEGGWINCEKPEYLPVIAKNPDFGWMLYESPKPASEPDTTNILQRWLIYGEAMQKSGSELPRHLITDTQALLNIVPKLEGSK